MSSHGNDDDFCFEDACQDQQNYKLDSESFNIDQDQEDHSSAQHGHAQKCKTEHQNAHLIKQECTKIQKKQSQIQKLICKHISQQICDPENKNLYPDLMGPHPIYTINSVTKEKQQYKPIELRKRLKQWMRKYWASKFYKNNFNEQAKNLDQMYSPFNINISANKRNGTYKKYSLFLKKKIIGNILQQRQRQGENARSLRYYIVKQSRRLNIHPKNITRWMSTDLDRKEGGRKAKFPILQFKLANFIQANPNCKRRSVVQQAKKILAETGEDGSFNFSKGWFQRFRARLKKKKVIRSIQQILYDEKGSQIDKDKLFKIFIENPLKKQSQQFKKSNQMNVEQQTAVKRNKQQTKAINAKLSTVYSAKSPRKKQILDD